MSSAQLDTLTAQALALTDTERAELIERLALSRASTLHPDWEPELLRRLEELDTGTAVLLPASTVLQEMQELIARGNERRA